MPGKDRTGPMGKGPLTGRGLGQCKMEANGMDKYVRVPKGDMESYVKRPKGDMESYIKTPKGDKYEPKTYMDKAKKGTRAKNPKDIVESIL